VRTDLPLATQLVQVGHACLHAGATFPQPTLPAHLVVLAVPSGGALQDALDRAAARGIPYCVFYEPDDQLGLTAAASAPLTGAARQVFRRYPLWQVAAPLPRGPPACAGESGRPGAGAAPD
jgi:hypothetical protein